MNDSVKRDIGSGGMPESKCLYYTQEGRPQSASRETHRVSLPMFRSSKAVSRQYHRRRRYVQVDVEAHPQVTGIA